MAPAGKKPNTLCKDPSNEREREREREKERKRWRVSCFLSLKTFHEIILELQPFPFPFPLQILTILKFTLKYASPSLENGNGLP